MTHNYRIEGMTCDGCVANVKQALLKMPDVINSDVSLPNKAVIEMQQHVSVKQLQQAISPNGKYVISEDNQTHNAPSHSVESTDAFTGNWLHTYKPLLLILAFVAGVAHLSAYEHGSFDPMLWMRYFMAGFFLTFSFFKLLDLRGFASAYSSYDMLAKAVPMYGYVYPFIELALGLAYLTGVNPLLTNWVTLAVMGFSSIGVIQSVVNKQKIRCACLGAVFNLPMSTVTIVEDLSMVGMATLMLTTFHS